MRMIRGIETLGELEKRLRQIRSEITALDTQKEQLFAQTQRNKRAQSEILKEIAKIHLDAIEEQGESLYPEYSEIEMLLDQRQGAFDRLQEKIADLNRRLEETEEERSRAHYKLEEALMRVTHLQEEVQQKLKENPAYTTQLSRTQEAEKIAKHTAQKAQSAIADYKEKMRPFEEDELFSYLYNRHYGTSAYKAGGLIRLLDGWVASLSDYEAYRPTYWTLSQIPKRLEIHAAQKQKAYEAELQKLVEMERSEAAKAGLEDAKRIASDAQQEVDSLDEKIAAQEKALDTALQEQRNYLADEDSYAEQIMQVIRQRLRHYGAEDLYALSQRTDTAEDDRLSLQLGELKNKEADLEEEITRNRRAYDAKLQALREIEALRHRFKSSRYDDIRSGFDNNVAMGSVLGEILGGVLNNAGAWERMSRHQRPLNNGWLSDFGSGGFAEADSPWYSPTGSSGNFGLPDTGGMFDSETFRTGGGF